MDSMGHAVQSMLRRLQADLADDQIGHALQGFNLDSWQQQNQHHMLKECLQTLSRILLNGDRKPGATLAAIAKALTQAFQAAKKLNLGTTNRSAWSWVLHPGWRGKYLPTLVWTDGCQQLIEFYVSLQVNTTNIERDLGELLAQLSSHSGPLSSSGETITSIMEVSLEGPQREEDLFTQSEVAGGPLQPTAFARLCAKLWLKHFGRRFRYAYKKPSSRSKVHGAFHNPRSLAGRIAGRTCAATAAASATGPCESFVPGLSLPLTQPSPSLPGTRWAKASGSSAKLALKNFEKNTDRKKQRSFQKEAALFLF